MSRGLRFSLGASGLLLLLVLTGCGRGFWNTGERAAWRHEAEVACLKSGEVKLGAGVVQIEPIEGPGMCGADFPLKVSMLGDASAVPMSYGDDMRPPAAIPGGSSGMPNWPVNDQRYAPVQSAPMAPVRSAPMQPAQTAPIRGETMRWVPGPQGVAVSPSGPGRYAPPAAGRPMPLDPSIGAPARDDIPDDAMLPEDRAPRTQPAYNPPPYQPQPRLGPTRGPATPIAASLTPAATLACPLVSALDRWVTEGVQPAAQRWFGHR